jgi:LysR family hydrogen peroxide-inducible transcriptional activator
MNLSGLSLRDFEYVLAVADCGGFVKAAERCRVAQPSMSVQVRKLEARLGTAIFERASRSTIVTPEGRLLIEQMRKILLETRSLFTIAQQQAMPFGGILRLSAIATLGPYYFPYVLQGLRARYPEVSLILSEGNTSDLTSDLLRGDIDAVLRAGPVTDPGLQTSPLFCEPFLLACPTGHAATSKRNLGWGDLKPRDRLLLEEDYFTRDHPVAAWSEATSLNRHATSLETLKYLVAAGEGCTLLPALAATPDIGLDYVPLPTAEYQRQIYLIWRASDPRSDDFDALAGVLRELSPQMVMPLHNIAA